MIKKVVDQFTLGVVEESLKNLIQSRKNQLIDRHNFPEKEVGSIEGLEDALKLVSLMKDTRPVNIRKNSWGEYRVPDPENPEHAYLCTDKEDAIHQAHFLHPGRVIKLNGKIV
jgi:hypothetical protein